MKILVYLPERLEEDGISLSFWTMIWRVEMKGISCGLRRCPSSQSDGTSPWFWLSKPKLSLLEYFWCSYGNKIAVDESLITGNEIASPRVSSTVPSPPQAENFQDLSLTLYRKYTIHYTENTRVTVRTGTAFSGTCSPEAAQVSRLRRAVYGKPFRLWEWDSPLWECKTAQKHLMGNIFAGPPIPHRGGE